MACPPLKVTPRCSEIDQVCTGTIAFPMGHNAAATSEGPTRTEGVNGSRVSAKTPTRHAQSAAGGGVGVVRLGPQSNCLAQNNKARPG
jgi:hypothetical protein